MNGAKNLRNWLVWSPRVRYVVVNLLKGSSLRGGGGNDGTVLHGVVLLKGLDELSDGGPLLTNGNVDTVELALLVAAVVPSLLVKHGVESDGSLTSLTVTNDQLTLTTANRHHGVDGLETSLHGLVDGLAGQDTGGLDLSAAPLGGLDRTLAVNRVTKSVDNTAEQTLANWHVDLDFVSFCVLSGPPFRMVDVQSRQYA